MKTSKELFDQFYKDLQSLGIDYPKDSIETKIENGYDSETGICGLGITIPTSVWMEYMDSFSNIVSRDCLGGDYESVGVWLKLG